ncbi:MAG: hypothetical protein ACLU5I_08285 [Alistipes finegoldii]
MGPTAQLPGVCADTVVTANNATIAAKNIFFMFCYFNSTKKLRVILFADSKYTKLIRFRQTYSTNRTFFSLKTKACGFRAAGFRYRIFRSEPEERYFSLSAACAAARRAMGTRNGEQLT